MGWPSLNSSYDVGHSERRLLLHRVVSDLQVLAGAAPFASEPELHELFLDFAERIPAVHSRADAIVISILLTQTLRRLNDAPSSGTPSTHTDSILELMTREPFKAAIRALEGHAVKKDGQSNSRVLRLLALLEARFNVTGLTSGALAADVGVSTWHLSRLLRRRTGKTFHELLRATRLRHACRLLRTTDDSIKTVAFSCGYRSSSQFDRHFRAAHGVSPSRYRDAIRATF